MSIQQIHHINFLVHDLDKGIAQYEKVLGQGVFTKDELLGRGVMTARAKVGDQWLVLVQPTDMSLAPGKHLQQHGEGFFLLSLPVDDIDKEVDRLHQHGISCTDNSNRKGLLNWWVRDINTSATGGVQLQLCQEIGTENEESK